MKETKGKEKVDFPTVVCRYGVPGTLHDTAYPTHSSLSSSSRDKKENERKAEAKGLVSNEHRARCPTIPKLPAFVTLFTFFYFLSFVSTLCLLCFDCLSITHEK